MRFQILSVVEVIQVKYEITGDGKIKFSKFSWYFLDISDAFLHTSNSLPHSFTSLIILYDMLRYCNYAINSRT